MRRRPRPSRRRGLIRAGLVVIALTALLVIAIFAYYQATTPTVHAPAPTPPTTPGPVLTPAISTTPAPLRTLRPATSGPLPRATAAATKPKRQSLAPPGSGQFLNESLPSARLKRGTRASTTWVAYFTGRRNAYSGASLYLRSGSATERVGGADPFVRPIWAPAGKSLLFVRVAPTHSYPGATWSLWRFDVSGHHSTLLVRTRALGLDPLGQVGGRVLYIVTRASDTSVYAVSGRSHRFVTILIPQPIVTASLSPGGRYIGLMAPTACTYCTLDVYDLSQDSLWNGPSGLPSEYDMAWTADGKTVVVAQNGRLAALQPGNQTGHRFSWPKNLALSWPHIMKAAVSPSFVKLVDTVTGRVYEGR